MTPEEILKAEGFPNVYKWVDKPGEEYKKHLHKDKVAFFVIKG